MQRSEVEAIHRLIEERRQAAAPPERQRPFGVTLIAGFQLFKAGVLLLMAVMLREAPELVRQPGSALYPLLYVATRGKYDLMHAALGGATALAGLLFLLSLYLVAIGLGMLFGGGWARRTLIFSGGLTLALYAKSRLWPDPAAMASPDMTNFHLLLAIDAAIFVYLLRSDAADTFASAERRPGRFA